jgi:preprotein translocase subunit SecE
MPAPPASLVRGAFLYLEESSNVARTSPGEFIRQVRAETAKVHWPSRKETVATAIMVMIMTLLLAFFFFGVDAFFSSMVRFLLSFLAK